LLPNSHVHRYTPTYEFMDSDAPTTPPPPPTPRPKFVSVVLSLVRHAECVSNASHYIDRPDPLTPRGLEQAKALGEEWANVRIDALYSSPLQRAHHTAREISTQNMGHPEIIKDSNLEEHHWNREAIRAYNEGNNWMVQQQTTGFLNGSLDRSYQPSGGESYDQVAARALSFITIAIMKHGVPLSEIPHCLLFEKIQILPEGIPHIVIVSHNVLMTEMYEALHSWGKDHVMTDAHWKNACWSRHMLCYDVAADKLQISDF